LFGALQAEGHHKTIPNLSEYLLMTQAAKGKMKLPMFWFKCGLRYFETIMPQKIDNQLIQMAIFYAMRNQPRVAEELAT